MVYRGTRIYEIIHRHTRGNGDYIYIDSYTLKSSIKIGDMILYTSPSDIKDIGLYKIIGITEIVSAKKIDHDFFIGEKFDIGYAIVEVVDINNDTPIFNTVYDKTCIIF